MMAVSALAPAVSSASALRSNHPDETHFAKLVDVARQLQTRDMSQVEATRNMLYWIKALGGHLESDVTVTADLLLDAARRTECEIMAGNYRGPLHGVPIGIKVLRCTRGVPTASGTNRLSMAVSALTRTAVGSAGTGCFPSPSRLTVSGL